MASVNKVILVGYLGRDPEVRYTPEGDAICNLPLATTSQWKDKQTGERKEETEWHRIVAYKRLAEIMGEYLRKGRPVYIEGRLKTRKWQDKDTGQDRYSTEIVADQMQMLGGRDDGQGGHAADAPDQVPASRRGKPANDYQRTRDGSQAAPATGGGGAADMDDDIPFAPACTRRALHTI